MYRLLWFLKRISVFALFVLIEVMALRYYSSSSVYSKAKLVSAANATVGTLSRRLYAVGSYFNLSQENKILNQEVATLRNQLDLLLADTTTVHSDSQDYIYLDAKIVDNTVSKQHNYFIVNKGMRDGAHENMAVIAGDNIIGYVLKVSERFSVAISLINTDFKSSGQIKDIDYFGSIFWDGLNSEYITLTEIAKYAHFEKGDTVVTTGYSTIFPPHVKIGTVESFEIVNNTYYDIKVKIGTNMSALNNVTLVSYINAHEKEELLEQVEQK